MLSSSFLLCLKAANEAELAKVEGIIVSINNNAKKNLMLRKPKERQRMPLREHLAYGIL